MPGAAQRDGGGAAGDAAADDRHVGVAALGHGAPPRTGIGFDRRLTAQAADALDVDAASAGEKLRSGVPADAALAAAHADAREGLEPVDLARILVARGLAQRARRDPLAAADDLLVGDIVEEMVRKRDRRSRAPCGSAPAARAVDRAARPRRGRPAGRDPPGPRARCARPCSSAASAPPMRAPSPAR